MTEPIAIVAETVAGADAIFTPDALAFVGALHERFDGRRRKLLEAREARQKRIDAGEALDFRADTQAIRDGNWTVAEIPPALLDRRVEITGPAEPKMIIGALNSGAKVFMADLEDALSPTWARVVEGQIALKAAARRELEFTSPEGKAYRLNPQTATLIVRPRGWHLSERHATWNGVAASGSLFDFGLFFFHSARVMAEAGTGPFFYLPKLESMEEAALWADVFAFAEETIGLPHGTIRATVLIETITAVYEMDEILYALRDYCAGLNCGRWDYIFSYIKKFARRPERVLPERGQVTMKVPFLTAYYELLIQTCHRRNAFAMGGMAAQIPVKNDEAANERAFAAVRADKEREASAGHDGTWVAHPALVPVAMEVFDRLMPGPNQREKKREDVRVMAEQLVAVPEGTITRAGLENNVNVALQYLAAWLKGSGAVPIHNLMEDAATAEISRSQLWQWAKHGAKLDTGETITLPMVEQLIDSETYKLGKGYGDAADLLHRLVAEGDFAEFLTLPAYDRLG